MIYKYTSTNVETFLNFGFKLEKTRNVSNTCICHHFSTLFTKVSDGWTRANTLTAEVFMLTESNWSEFNYHYITICLKKYTFELKQ